MARVSSSTFGKSIHALAHGLRHPSLTIRSLGRGMRHLYRDKVARESPLGSVALRDLVDPDTSVTLSNFEQRDGNVSLYELTVIAALARARAPGVVWEIGTFDGNTTYQMAANTPETTQLFTLDLPPRAAAAGRLDPQDRTYIDDARKLRRRFLNTPVAARVTQSLGDSATFDFDAWPDPDFVFIDGSHSYAYVKSDTERVLPRLRPGGLVLWHDYQPGWPGVIRYLDERTDLALRRIDGTTLVVLRAH